MSHHRRRMGFTLIELLVVIAIIGILIALLLPAVQKVREAASRTKCSNNLKQMGLALHNYAGQYGRFPAAYNGTGVNPGWGWGAKILPFVEQDNLYKDMGVETVDPATRGNPFNPIPDTQIPLTLFRCPSDRGPNLNPFRLNHAMSNYRAIAGVYPTPPPHSFIAGEDRGGVMFQNSKIRIGDITDGTSNTVVVGECKYDDPVSKWAALWAVMSGERVFMGQLSIFVSDVMWWFDDTTADINGSAPQAFSSWHVGGAFMAFCDGSVRFFREGGDVLSLRWLGSRNDGMVVNEDF